MKNVTEQECNTFDEVCKVVNKLIDNTNLIEGKVLALDSKVKAVRPKAKVKGGK